MTEHYVDSTKPIVNGFPKLSFSIISVNFQMKTNIQTPKFIIKTKRNKILS